MVRLASSLSLLALMGTSLGAVLSRQATTPAVSTIFTFPSGSFAENLAVRANGKILVTLMTTAELWEVDPQAKNATKLTKFPLSSASGITEYAPDKFAVLVGSSGPSGVWGVWKVDMTVDPPTIASFMNGTGWGIVNGMTTLNNDTVLVADAGKGCIYSVNMTSGAWEIVINDVETLGSPPGAAFAFGVDGIRIFSGSLFFTNIQKETFGKVAINATGHARESLEILQPKLLADDFAFGPDGAAYLATGRSNTILKVTPDWTKPSTIAATVTGPSACQFGRAEWDAKNLYVTSSGGALYSFTP